MIEKFLDKFIIYFGMFAILFVIIFSAVRRNSYEMTTYTVVPGDTLWSIAEKYNPGIDPRKVISKMAATEGKSLTAEIMPGDHIMVPVWENEAP